LKYRPSIVVYIEILTILAEGPHGPTKLARRANISYDRLPDYTDGLLAKGAIRKDSRDGHDEYSLTPDGAQALEDLRKGMSRLPL
jgi:predicted transcriptional regulator